MGRLAILLVFVGTLGAAYATVSRNETKFNTSLTQTDYEDAVLARETAESALNLIVSRVKAARRQQLLSTQSRSASYYEVSDLDKAYKARKYDVSSTEKTPGDVDVFAKGMLGINEYSINANIQIKYGRLFDAITFDGEDEDLRVLATNKMSVSGKDRKTDGNNKFLGSDGDGVPVHGASIRSEKSFDDFWDNAETQQFEGKNGEGDIINEPPPIDLAALAVEIEAYHGINRVTYEGGGSMDKKNDLGSQVNPAITVVNGDFWMKNQSKGYGVLLVNGDLNIDAGSRFEGLILVMGENRTIDIGGNVEIYGALASHFTQKSGKGKTTIKVGGDARIQYSSEALKRSGAFVSTLHEANNMDVTVTRISESASRKDGLTGVQRTHNTTLDGS